jgi:Spy/CpxP family protein refolding chaperone
MKRWTPVLALLVAVALVAAGACWLTGHFMARRAPAPSHAEAHQWIHSQLQLTVQQEAQLAPIEQRYDEQKRHYTELIRLANMELAQALLRDRADSPHVGEIAAKIHAAQGELQKATLRHVFEMQPVLTPEQYDRLLNLTANALYEVPRE